jgi:hypothetical protein
MPPHGESLEVPLSPGKQKASLQRLPHVAAATETTTLTCAGCGKVGVSICAVCSKKPRYKTMMARANPLQERDPELYKRLDEMSRWSLQEVKGFWDEFCLEIKAEDFYEHLPIFVAILREGKWRTDALNPKTWFRGQLARRAKRVSAPEDYSSSGMRRPGGPKFDKRNGALTAFTERPFVEFEVVSGDGDTISPDEAIEGRIERKKLQTAGGEDDDIMPMPADRDSLHFLGRHTFAERLEALCCEELADALELDRPWFDQALAEAINNQRGLGERMGLDRDEAEVLAVIEVLWYVGPRKYLNFLDEANKRRIRNAWDRFDRKRKNPEWAALLRQALKEFANKTRAAWWHRRAAYEADYDRSLDRQGWQHLVRPDNYGSWRLDESHPAWTELRPFDCVCRALDFRFCTCRNSSSPIGGGWTNPAGGSMRPGPVDGVVRLDCDLPPEEKRVYSAYEKKRNFRNRTISRKIKSP